MQEIAQLSSGQDAKTNDHVGRNPVYQTVWLRDLSDDAEFVTQAQDPRPQSDPQPHDNGHGKSRFFAARLDQVSLKISQGGAALRRMHRSILLGQTETKFENAMGRTAAKNIERRLQTRQSLQVEAWQSPHSPRLRFDSPAPQSSGQSNDQHSVLPGAY